MKKIRIVLLISFFISGIESCSPKIIAADQIELTGIIREQTETTYQYGTHILSFQGTTYALKSQEIDLSVYLDQKVTLVGKKIEGYPVDGGPEYIEVLKIR